MQADPSQHHPASLRFGQRSQMKLGRRSAALLGLLAFALALAGCGGASGSDGSAPTTVPPLALPGPYPIACSNVAQDFARVAPGGEEAQAHWEGRPAADGTPRYAADLLTDPVNALSVTVNAPNDTNLYGSFAGKPVGFVVLACYPTTAGNSRPDFSLPTGQMVPARVKVVVASFMRPVAA
jgi:hypothetical protein